MSPGATATPFALTGTVRVPPLVLGMVSVPESGLLADYDVTEGQRCRVDCQCRLPDTRVSARRHSPRVRWAPHDLRWPVGERRDRDLGGLGLCDAAGVGPLQEPLLGGGLGDARHAHHVRVAAVGLDL